MDFKSYRPQDIVNSGAKEDYARKIVALASNDNFDEMQKDENFAEMYDLALRYLDKELADEKESNWQKIFRIIEKLKY